MFQIVTSRGVNLPVKGPDLSEKQKHNTTDKVI